MTEHDYRYTYQSGSGSQGSQFDEAAREQQSYLPPERQSRKWRNRIVAAVTAVAMLGAGGLLTKHELGGGSKTRHNPGIERVTKGSSHDHPITGADLLYQYHRAPIGRLQWQPVSASQVGQVNKNFDTAASTLNRSGYDGGNPFSAQGNGYAVVLDGKVYLTSEGVRALDAETAAYENGLPPTLTPSIDNYVQGSVIADVPKPSKQ
jgi:hypothetical protein